MDGQLDYFELASSHKLSVSRVSMEQQ